LTWLISIILSNNFIALNISEGFTPSEALTMKHYDSNSFNASSNSAKVSSYSFLKPSSSIDSSSFEMRCMPDKIADTINSLFILFIFKLLNKLLSDILLSIGLT